MDIMKILKRAWAILWKYRALWVFGFILALTVGGSATGRIGGNSGYRFNQRNIDPNSSTFPYDWKTFRDPAQVLETMRDTATRLMEGSLPRSELNILLGVGIAFTVMVLLASLLMTFLRYISETAVIRMVADSETTGEKVSVRQGFRLGWSPASWRLFLIDLLVNGVPGLILFILLGLITWGFVVQAIAAAHISQAIFSLAVLAGLAFLLILVFSLYFLMVRVFIPFFRRACVLENLGVSESIRRGFALVRLHWQNVGLFWLVMIGLGIAWWVVSFILLFILIPIFIATVVLAALVAGVPGLLAGWISSLFVGNPWPLIIGILFGLPVFIPLAISPWFFFEGLVQVFASTSWTLAYRELTALQTRPEILPPPAS